MVTQLGRDREAFDWMKSYFSFKHRMPTMSQTARYLGISKPGAQHLFQRLVDKGVLERTGGRKGAYSFAEESPVGISVPILVRIRL